MASSVLESVALPECGPDLWWVRIPQVDVDSWLADWHGMLGEQDLERLRHKNLPKGHGQFLFTRLVLRRLLSAYHPDIAPAQWQFLKTASGRPYVAAEQTPLSFNLSHTSDLLLVAFSQSGDPGIDVENINRQMDIQNIADRYFFPSEANQLAELAKNPPADRDWFLSLWTLKEAAVKATGLGLAKALHKFEFGCGADGEIWHQCHQLPATSMSFWSARYQDFVIGLASAAHNNQSELVQWLVVRELRWPDSVTEMSMDWQRSQSRNSSTNFEP